MNVILLISLCFLFVLAYILHGRRIGPSNIFVLSFLIPTIVVILYEDYFNYEISSDTILIVFVILLLFVIFESIPNAIKKKQIVIQRRPVYNIPKSYFFIGLIVIIINLWLQYRYLMEVGAYYGANNFVSAYAATRLMLVDYQNTGISVVRMPSYSIIFSVLSASIEIVGAHIFIYKRLFEKKTDLRLLIIIVLYIITLIISTSRASFFPVIIHLIYVFLICAKQLYSRTVLIKKYLFKSLILIILGCVFFLYIGALRVSSDADDIAEVDASWTVASYVGAPIIGLDLYVKKGLKRTEYFGEHSFRTYYDIARLLGIPYKRPQFHKEDFYVGKGGSNVYTGLYYWISDFSMWGAFLYAAFWGWLIGLFYQKEPSVEKITGIYVRSFFYYVLAMMFFDDQFNSIISIMMLLRLLIIYILQKKLTRKVYTVQ